MSTTNTHFPVKFQDNFLHNLLGVGKDKIALSLCKKIAQFSEKKQIQLDNKLSLEFSQPSQNIKEILLKKLRIFAIQLTVKFDAFYNTYNLKEN